MGYSRIAALAGFVFVALAIANGILLGNPPYPEADLAQVRSYAQTDEAPHKLALVALVLALPFAAVFFAGVIDRVRASDRVHDESWGLAALVGAVLAGAATIVGDTFYGLLTYRAGETLDDATLGLLKDGEVIAYSAVGVGLATVAGCVAIATFRHGILPKWHGLVGVIVAMAGVLGTVAMVVATDAGAWLSTLATVGLGVWVVATSLALTRSPSHERLMRTAG